MSVEWRQQSQNVFPTLGAAYIPVLTGDFNRSTLSSSLWKEIRRINQENARIMEDYQKALHRTSDAFDPAMFDYLVNMNRLTLPSIKTQVRNKFEQIMNATAERMAAQLAQSPDDIKHTVSGPDSLYKTGQAASAAGSLLGFGAAIL